METEDCIYPKLAWMWWIVEDLEQLLTSPVGHLILGEIGMAQEDVHLGLYPRYNQVFAQHPTKIGAHLWSSICKETKI